MPLISYDEYAPSILQKVVFTAVQALGVGVGAWLLITTFPTHPTRSLVLIAFSAIYFVRSLPMLFVFMRRRMGWGEAIGFSLWLAFLSIGAAWLGARDGELLPGIDLVSAVLLYMLGSLLNTAVEQQRYVWKRVPEHANALYTEWMYAVVRHPNYEWDIFVLLGWAIAVGNPLAFIIPLVVLLSYVFYSIPTQEAHLRARYGEAFAEYKVRTKWRLIPGVY